MAHKPPVVICLFCVLFCTTCGSSWAKFIIHSQKSVDIELIAHDGLADSSLFKRNVAAEGKHEIDTKYRGLALLRFKEGQQYPVIIGDEHFTLNISDPSTPPSFTDNGENKLFYTLLSSGTSDTKQHPFATLMIQAKQLLESSHSIHTIKELTAKKKEFHEFVASNYESLKHSDMIRLLIAQCFMMHEYVGYHIEGAPATDIRVQYQKAVLDGVESWLDVLKTYIPDYEVLNYCVSLYYNRSMVTLASLIVENFKDVAYCPGNEQESVRFPKNLSISDADGNRIGVLSEFGNNTITAFVSDDCPVSMVATVVKARRLAAQKKDIKLIVVPLQQLSDKHLALRRMLTTENMYFINDEEWRKKNLPKDIRLPLFVDIAISNL